MRTLITCLFSGALLFIGISPAAAAPSPNPIFIIPNSGSAGPCQTNLSAQNIKDAATAGNTVTTVDASGGRILTVTNVCTDQLTARVEDSVGNILGLPTITASGSTDLDITNAAAVYFAYFNGVYTSVTDAIFFTNTSVPESSNNSSPPPVLQQFGMPVTGTCVDVAPDSLNIGGAASGGWGESWAQWANDSLGGPVCTRTLVYSNSLGKWIVD